MTQGDWTSLCFRKFSNRTSGRAVASFVLILAVVLCLPSPARADRENAARDQFARAVRMRTMLEGLLPKDRSVTDYKETIAAYQKVYLISAQSPEVTASLVAEAELYREMGYFFDRKYFQASIDMYKFLIAQYPGTRYRGEALFAVAQIQKDDQKNLQAAETTYREFLKRFPLSNHAADARAALAEIAQARGPAAPAALPARTEAAGAAGASRALSARQGTVATPGSNSIAAQSQGPAMEEVAGRPGTDFGGLGPIVQPQEPRKSWAAVESVQAFNSEDRTRIIVRLNDTVTFDSAHLRAPDRLYFDLHQARISRHMRGQSVDFQSGLLKSLRVGQNRPDVVRIVLNADAAKDYSAVLVGKPYRLVIDLGGAKAVAPNSPAETTAAAATGTPAVAPATETPAVASTGESSAPRASSAAEQAPTETVNVDSAKLSPNVARRLAGTATPRTTASLTPPPEPRPMRNGGRSLSRELGLKISRIVIDPGHGGRDTGTIGPHGLMEKDVCLDVALRLGRIIQKDLPGAQVVYTRKTDVFIPLQERTAIANKAKADLFISIHANSSRDRYARGIETYYLNFATSPEAMEVATRENAYSTESIHDLQNLIQKIARNDKIEESKELATDIQGALSHRLELVSASEHNRGVKRAPFVVLIGADMPSVLCEISFLSNPTDERLLRRPIQRERIAMGIYRGIATYLASINSLSYNKQKFASDDRGAATAVASSSAAGSGSRD